MTRNVVRFTMVAAIVTALFVPAVSAAAEPANATPTFSIDVAPIVQRSCQSCHRPGQMGPMSLLTYEEVRPYARAIKAKVSSREMPPWGVDRYLGIQEFKNDLSLSDSEIATIERWVDTGAPMGDPTHLPAPRKFDNDYEWTLPEAPDLIVTSPPYTTEANGKQIWVEKITDVIELKEDRWVKAYQARPSKEGARVVHHYIAYIVKPDGTEDGFGLHYVPGKPATVYPDGSGFLLEAGSKVRFDLHVDSVDEPVTDRPEIGLMLYPKGYKPETNIVRLNWSSLGDLDLPAGETMIRNDGYALMRGNYRLLSFLPHFHIRGQRSCIEIIYPETGEIEPLNCFDFDFYWQTVFQYDDDVQPLIPKGTILHTIYYHDNSTASRINPDPENWTGFGQRTVDDMAIAMGEVQELTDEQFREARQERLKHMKAASSR